MRSTMSRSFLVAAGLAALSFGPPREATAQSFRREGRIVGREMRQEGRADARAFGNYGNYGYNNYGYNGPSGYYGPGSYGPGSYGPGGYGPGGYGPAGYGAGYGGGYGRGGYGPGGAGLGAYGGPGYNNYGAVGPGGYGGPGYGGAGYGAPGYGANPAYGNFANNNPPPAPRERAYLGVTMSETPDGIVRVKNVRPDSPAEEAGLRPGDEILAINEREVYSSRDVTRMIGRHHPGDVVQIDVDRNGSDRNLEVVLGEPNGQMQAGNFGGPGEGPMVNGPYGNPAYGNPAYGNPAYGNVAQPRTARQAVRQRNQSLDPNLYQQNGY